MNLNSIKIFFRNVRKQKVVTVMNIFGLSLGMVFALLIWPWAIQEFSYDKFHRNGDHIYQVFMYYSYNDGGFNMPGVCSPLGVEAPKQLPEIERMCRIVSASNVKVEVNHRYYEKNRVIMADENFFDFFTFPLKSGEKTNVLNTLDGVVIDESTALLLFPGENAIGKIITYDDKSWQVSGIMYDFPVNSHIQANIVVPLFDKSKNHSWDSDFNYNTYFQFHNGTDIGKLTDQLNQMGLGNMASFKQNKSYFSLRQLKDLHWESDSKPGAHSKTLVITLVIAALIILLISCINFTSLFVSVSFLRACSVGIRQTHGARRRNLILSFYKETFYYVLLSVCIAGGVALLFAPVCNRMLNTDLQISFGNVQFWISMVLLSVFTTIAAGTFPAFYMTRFNVVQTMSGRFKGNELSFLQKGILALQFTIALASLLSAFFIHKQVNMMITMNLGANEENVLYMRLQDKLLPAYDVVRGELMKNPSVVDVTMRRGMPYNQFQSTQVEQTDSREPIKYTTEICKIHGNYFDFMNMKLLAGENPFDADYSIKNHCVVNETATQKLNLGVALGSHLEFLGQEFVVVGVVKDAYTKKINEPTDPVLYLPIDDFSSFDYILVKINGNPQSVIKTLQKMWEGEKVGTAFEYGFLNEAYEVLYMKEIGLLKIFSWFMLFTLLIGISGLFNMSYYAVGRRMKEIGLRKINGAAQSDLLVLLNGDFVTWVLSAFLIACPLAWLFISNWQQEFLVKAPLSWWIFVLTGGIAVIVTLLTVSYQTIRASRVNPVEVLKNE